MKNTQYEYTKLLYIYYKKIIIIIFKNDKIYINLKNLLITLKEICFSSALTKDPIGV